MKYATQMQQISFKMQSPFPCRLHGQEPTSVEYTAGTMARTECDLMSFSAAVLPDLWNSVPLYGKLPYRDGRGFGDDHNGTLKHGRCDFDVHFPRLVMNVFDAIRILFGRAERWVKQLSATCPIVFHKPAQIYLWNVWILPGANYFGVNESLPVVDILHVALATQLHHIPTICNRRQSLCNCSSTKNVEGFRWI